MLRLLTIGALVAAVSADFIQLQEVCRTVEDERGLCVTSAFCCTALGGKIGRVAKKSGVLAGSMPGYLARSIGEDNENGGCSYNGQCCVFPDINDFSCDTCGVKGNGEIEKEDPEDTTTQSTVTTPQPEKDIVERIVGGRDADRYEWCWQVALMNSTGLFGGGALVARNWVITAAHKVAGKFLDEFVVVLGEYDFAHEDTGARVYYTTALNVFLHPKFNPETFDYNLALIRIPDAPCGSADSDETSVCAVCLNDEDVTFEPTTTTTTQASTTTIFTTTEPTTTTYAYGGSSAGRLTASFSLSNSLMAVVRSQRRRISTTGGAVVDTEDPENPFANKACYMTGWGSTGATQLAPRLQEARMAIIRDDVCLQAFQDVGVSDPYIPEASYCGADAGLTRGSCYGDGGGPFVCQDRANHIWELYGVISLGTNMCMQGAQNGPTIYTDVGQMYAWITQTIHDDLPSVASPEDQGKTYKVPKCGEEVFDDETGCPDRPPYLQSRKAVNYKGALTPQQIGVLAF